MRPQMSEWAAECVQGLVQERGRGSGIHREVQRPLPIRPLKQTGVPPAIALLAVAGVLSPLNHAAFPVRY